MPAGRIRYADLDSAASARALVAVAEQVTKALPLYASVHRGAGYLSQVSTALYESARETVARFVGARDDDVCVFTRHTTDALNLLAGCVPAGRRPGARAGLRAPRRPAALATAAGTGDGAADRAQRRRDTSRSVGRTRPRALRPARRDGASNVAKSLPLEDVVRLARAAGTRVIVDGAQLVPHRSFSLAATGVDYVAFSGHQDLCAVRRRGTGRPS